MLIDKTSLQDRLLEIQYSFHRIKRRADLLTRRALGQANLRQLVFGYVDYGTNKDFLGEMAHTRKLLRSNAPYESFLSETGKPLDDLILSLCGSSFMLQSFSDPVEDRNISARLSRGLRMIRLLLEVSIDPQLQIAGQHSSSGVSASTVEMLRNMVCTESGRNSSSFEEEALQLVEEHVARKRSIALDAALPQVIEDVHSLYPVCRRF